MRACPNVIARVTVAFAAVLWLGLGATVVDAQVAQSDVARLAAELSERDRWILLDGLDQDSAELITTEGSANYVFWTACVANGWMVARPPWPGGPAGMSLVAFMITPEGKVAIPPLLKATAAQ